jgi:hypothetical protein
MIEIFVQAMNATDLIQRSRIERLAIGLVRASIMAASIKGPEQALRELDDRQ